MIKFKKYEKYGVRICNKINCNSDNPHFHVSVPNGGGTALTIMGDEKIPFGAKTWMNSNPSFIDMERMIERLFKAIKIREDSIKLALS